MRNSYRRSSFKTQELYPKQDPAPRRAGIPAPLFYASFGILCLTNIVTLVAFLMSADVTALLDDRSDNAYLAYQERIVLLRQEVDRLHSRQYAQAGNLNLQLQELSHQQQVLSEQHEYVKAIAKKAKDIGINVASTQTPPKVDLTLTTGAISPSKELPDLEYVADALGNMMRDNRRTLAELSDAATQSTNTIVSALSNLGIKTPKVPALKSNVGGPFVPIPGSADNASLVDDANSAMAAMERFVLAKRAIKSAPIHAPLPGKSRISSNFGNRKDPFLGRSAFHSGMDFAAPRGTLVHSAGAGVVLRAGRNSGYGKMVEIRHPSGLITRYAHLSAYRVKAGQKVKAGQVIAKVGSTGRSTGPHLHFEVRRNDKPVNPSRYLKTGNKLAKYL